MVSKSNTKLVLAILIILLIGFTKLFFNENDSIILAVVGPDHITVDDFIKSYSFGSSKLKSKNNPKNSYLESMINEMILSQELSKNKKYMIKDNDSRLELLRKELIVEKIFKTEVEDKIEITDEEILKSIINSQKKIKITYVYCAKYDKILECNNFFIKGYDLTYVKKIMEENNEIIISQTPYMNQNQIVEPFKNIIFKLIPGQFSKIVQTELGYYILKIDDIITRSLSEIEIQNSKATHMKIIKNKKGDLLAKSFVNSYMSPKNIKVENQSFNILAMNLFQAFKKNDVLSMDAYSKNEFEQQSWIYDTLIVHSSGIIETKHILKEIYLRPFRFDTRNFNLFSNDLEKKLAIVLRDYFLVLEHMDFYEIDYNDISNQINQWRRKLIIDDYIQEVYSKLAKYKIMSDTSYNLLNKKLDSLRLKTDISINRQLLSKVEVIDNIKGQIPELQLFKLGLPYLKKAYPTPDTIFKVYN